MDMTIIILQVVLCLTFIVTGSIISSGKLANDFKRLGLPAYFNGLTGATELTGGIGMGLGLLFPIFGVLAGVLLGTTMMIGAFSLFAVARDPFSKAVPALVLSLLSYSVVILQFLHA